MGWEGGGRERGDGGWGVRTYPGQNNPSLIHHSRVEAFFSYTSRLSSHCTQLKDRHHYHSSNTDFIHIYALTLSFHTE